MAGLKSSRRSHFLYPRLVLKAGAIALSFQPVVNYSGLIRRFAGLASTSTSIVGLVSPLITAQPVFVLAPDEGGQYTHVHYTSMLH